MPYYAVSAKVHALYGRRMTGEDYRQLMTKKTVSEAAAFLQSHKGYREKLAGLNTNKLHREDLENALRSTYVDEYRRIFSFMPMNDKAIMQFLLYRAEQDAILTAMHQLTSTNILEPAVIWDPILTRQSTLDLTGLQKATTFADIVHAAEHTIYGSTLQRILVGDSKNPTQAFVDNMMQVTYFAQLYKTVGKNYAGDAKKVLRQSLDSETDLINLVQFLRLKKHFSQEDVQRYSFPMPRSAKLKKEYMQQLIAAPDYDSAWQMVLDGPYGKLFRSISPLGLEAYLYTLQYNFARHQLRAATPTIYTPIAYLTLKEIELRNIISIIECIRYDGDPNAYVTLIGI
jgi:vacuolar-type H+-ATPase subunit C/Vma6